MPSLRQNLQAAIKSALERAVRDNDLVYVQPIPPPTQLPAIVGAGMVKISTPVEVSDPVGWLISRDSGMEPLFSGLVPYGVHLALSTSQVRQLL
jgi:programmed cell death 6-interacting protein